jgi:hypothetical protein
VASVSAASLGDTSPFINYFANWFVRVDSIRAKQPGWATPVVTSSPGLQELFRYDISRQSLADGHTLTQRQRQLYDAPFRLHAGCGSRQRLGAF